MTRLVFVKNVFGLGNNCRNMKRSCLEIQFQDMGDLEIKNVNDEKAKTGVTAHLFDKKAIVFADVREENGLMCGNFGGGAMIMTKA